MQDSGVEEGVDVVALADEGVDERLADLGAGLAGEGPSVGGRKEAEGGLELLDRRRLLVRVIVFPGGSEEVASACFEFWEAGVTGLCCWVGERME